MATENNGGQQDPAEMLAAWERLRTGAGRVSSAEPVDYAAALDECGFDAQGVARGVKMLESGRYFGFADVVSSLPLSGSSTLLRGHQVDAVVRRVAAQESAVAVARRRAAAGERVAARQAEERAATEERCRRLEERAESTRRLLGEMSEAELAGTVPLRPHLAEAMRQLQAEPAPKPPRSRPVVEVSEGEAAIDVVIRRIFED